MLRLRLPRADEGPTLTELCLRSKASHGYDEAFIEACRRELTVDALKPGIMVAEIGGAPAGMAEVSFSGEEAEMMKLFVEPAHQGNGVGRVLFEWVVEQARRHGARKLSWDGDPGAVPFYEKMGGIIVGRSPSGSIPGRTLPRLELRLGDAAEA